MEKLLRPKDAAEVLQVEVCTLYRWAYTGKIPITSGSTRNRLKRGFVEKLISISDNCTEFRMCEWPPRSALLVDSL